MSEYWIYNKDCLEKMEEIKDGCIDMILVDPPYGTTVCKWDSIIPLDLMWRQLNRIIKPNGAIVIFGTEPFSSYLRISNLNYYKYDWTWIKNRVTGFLNSKRQPLRNSELISIFYKNQSIYNPQMKFGFKPYSNVKKNDVTSVYGEQDDKVITVNNGERFPVNILNFKVVKSGRLHPTQKPLALMEYLIKTYTNKDELVLDFAMGSGTTGVACRNLDRNFIGIELDLDYFATAKHRIELAWKRKLPVKMPADLRSKMGFKIV